MVFVEPLSQGGALSYKENVGHQQRQALDKNMEHMNVIIFLVKNVFLL